MTWTVKSKAKSAHQGLAKLTKWIPFVLCVLLKRRSAARLWWFTLQGSLWAFCLTRRDNEWAPTVLWALKVSAHSPSPILVNTSLIFGLYQHASFSLSLTLPTMFLFPFLFSTSLILFRKKINQAEKSKRKDAVGHADQISLIIFTLLRMYVMLWYIYSMCICI